MSLEKHDATVVAMLARHRAASISRRQLVRQLGTLGVGLTAGVVGLGHGRRIGGASSDRYTGHQLFSLQQDGTPVAGEPPPLATPRLGTQPDGTTIWKVVAGSEIEDDVGVIELQAFFPREITVNTGDGIFFDIHGFHNVHFYPSGGQPAPLFVPETTTGASPAGAATPAAEEPRIILNPAAAFPSEGMTVDSATEVNSGLPLGGPQPIVIAFSTPGCYAYWCDAHADLEMMGTVVVQPAETAVPLDQGAVDQAAQAEMEALWAQVQALIAAQLALAGTPLADAANAEGTVHDVAVGLSASGIEINAFFPRDLTVAVGDTVRFVYTAADPMVRHTVTFAGDGPVPEAILVEGGEIGPPTLMLNPQYVEPAGGATHSVREFLNSGMFGQNPDLPPIYELTFDTAGSYDYYSAIHGSPGEGMAGKITVR